MSTARAEREAIAAAATAGALRRKTGENDPMTVGRRVAAALNAPDTPGLGDFRFFWMSAVTSDGKVLVANNYGIGYLPAGTHLPEQIHMVSADATIPVVDRARWATYPTFAVQGWAAHHDTRLRAVFGMRAHLEGFDAGVKPTFLSEDDIPPSGKMQGRNRLEVVAPTRAAELAATSNTGLTGLLPPASADANPPEDQTKTLWFGLHKTLMSEGAGREIFHLQAFQTYAVYAADMELYRAHSAPDAAVQRAAIADWYYWLYQYETLTEALADAPEST